MMTSSKVGRSFKQSPVVKFYDNLYANIITIMVLNVLTLIYLPLNNDLRGFTERQTKPFSIKSK